MQNALNKVYLNLVDTMLRTDSFYFSFTYDLTHSMQRLHNTSPDFSSLPLHERVSVCGVWCVCVVCVVWCVCVWCVCGVCVWGVSVCGVCVVCV